MSNNSASNRALDHTCCLNLKLVNDLCASHDWPNPQKSFLFLLQYRVLIHSKMSFNRINVDEPIHELKELEWDLDHLQNDVQNTE